MSGRRGVAFPATAGAVALRWLAAGAAAATLAGRLPDDPLRSTAAVVPLVVAALAEIDGWCTRRGLPRAAGGERAGQALLVGAAAVTAAGLLRHRAGLGLGPEPFAAALAVLLAFAVARLVARLAPVLGRRVPQRPSGVFFLLPLVVYLALLPWSTERRPPDGDEPYYLLVAHSLAYDADAELTDNYRRADSLHFLPRALEPQPGDPVGPRGALYSRHNLLLPAVLAPAYLVAGKSGALAMMGVFAALLAWLVLRLARHYVAARPGEALLAWGVAAFAPPLLLYSTQVWVEVPAALLAALALDHIGELERERRWTARVWLGIALPVILLPLLKIRFGLLAAPLLALAWWVGGRPRRASLALAGALGAVAAAILAYNWTMYGNPLKIHTLGELDPDGQPFREVVQGLVGILWDGAFGLFACAPVWLLLLPALLIVFRRGAAGAPARRIARDLLVFAPYLLLVAPRREWYGGWSPPFRYALVALPLLALLLVPLLARERRRLGARVLLAALLAATAILTLAWVAMPGWTYNFADGRTYLLDHLAARTGLDVARLFPSAVRLRLATWVWPLLTLVLVPLCWRWPGRRSRPFEAAAAAALLALAAVPLAAGALPTRVVELEDPYVTRGGGHLHPHPWVVERTRFRGGWTVREGEQASAPVISGGERVAIALEVQAVLNTATPLTLLVRAGGRELGRWRADRDREWQRLELGEHSWHSGERLEVAVSAPPHHGPVSGVIVDRVELRWR